MKRKLFLELVSFAIALALILSFWGGYLFAKYHAIANPPAFEILEEN